ncbi:diguanylate cyclase (GGDEF)-like protein/PAS domain S-box-containing protein [Agrobacterium vitis]|nr:diguanylate cyclase (GGDEF)-like protein/PAS domain S-box-containing protein [Agrobacterium vitis]MBE1438086.1 diguanylate cyclase (GGDEF)-like protein/PAS domain S-box-containing protein [Agrobacterium vitis]
MLFYLDRLNAESTLETVQSHAHDQLEHAETLISLYLDRDLAILSGVANVLSQSAATSSTSIDRLTQDILRRAPHMVSLSLIPNDGAALSGPDMEIPGLRVLADGRLQLNVVSSDPSSQSPVRLRAVIDGAKLIETAFRHRIQPASNQTITPPRIELLVIAQADGLNHPLASVPETANPDLAQDALETRDIPLLNGNLHLVARSGTYRGTGWTNAPPELVNFWWALLFVGLIFTALFSSIALLLMARNRHRRKIMAVEERHRVLAKRFELAMDSSNIGIWELTDGEAVIRHDGRATQLHGLRAVHANTHDFDSWLAAVLPNDRSKVERHLLRSRESDTAIVEEYRVQLKDGTTRHIRSVGAYSNQTTPGRVTGILMDITSDVAMQDDLRTAKERSDIKNAELELALDDLSIREQQLEELSERFELALDSYNCGVWQHDFSTGRTVWDDRMCQLYNVTPEGGYISEAAWLKNVHPQDVQMLLDTAKTANDTGSRINTTHRIILENGDVRYVRSTGQLRVDRNGGRKLSGVSFDVTADVLLTEELRKAKAEAEARNIELELTKNRIEYNALHDPLTGLANRRKLDRELDGLTSLARTSHARFTILHLDLDRFKEINDTLGHAAGDAMLCNAAEVLQRHVIYPDLVARIGGDEFVVLLRDGVDQQIAADLAARIIREMNIPFDFEGFMCRFGVSIGIAEANGIKADARKILIDADLALYEAKRKGRNRYEFFTQSLQANIATSRRIGDELLTALERDEITAWYQPQFCANSMELVGAEALVRWHHPERGILPTITFLKVAEDMSIMAQIDKIVLDCALRDRLRWATMGITVPKISVNVSARRLHDANLVESLQGLRIPPGSISFELVESIFLDDNDDTVTSNIENIKDLGIDVEIDDFGTGHTSIISLLKIKPKRLKIDRQLVMPILNSSRERALVRSIIEIARSLGVGTIAEGVETQAHADILRDLGCDLLQGFAFAHPLSAQDFAAFALQKNQRQAS